MRSFLLLLLLLLHPTPFLHSFVAWAQSTDAPSWGPMQPCPPSGGYCTLEGPLGPLPIFLSWVTELETGLSTSVSPSRSTFTAYTVVTVYNTVASTSRITTIFNEAPDGFTMPDVNSDGTRISTITVPYFDSSTTTVVTYPTPFYDWPDYYAWGGLLTVVPVSGNASGAQCVSAPTSTRFLTSNPQITSIGDVPEDPYGLNYGLATDPAYTGWAQVTAYFPEEIAMRQCADVPGYPSGAPRLGSWDPYWIHAETSVSYEGLDLASATPAEQPIQEAQTQTAHKDDSQPSDPPPDLTSGGDNAQETTGSPDQAEPDPYSTASSRDPSISEETVSGMPSPTITLDNSGCVLAPSSWLLLLPALVGTLIHA